MTSVAGLGRMQGYIGQNLDLGLSMDADMFATKAQMAQTSRQMQQLGMQDTQESLQTALASSQQAGGGFAMGGLA